MSAVKRGMGRGLDAILSVSYEEGLPQELRQVPVELISPNPSQPRRRFADEQLSALAASLQERGILQPVLVRPQPKGRYELIAGERRWRAAKIAGIAEIPAIVRRHDDAATLELALIENMAREDLNPVEEARACAALVEELGLTREEVGRRVGRSRVSVSNLMRLLDLPDDVLGSLEDGSLSEGHGRALLLAEDHAERRRLARAAAAEGWAVRTVEARAREANEAGSAVASRPRARSGQHPDAQAGSAAISQLLEDAFGAEVKVRCDAGGTYRAELSFGSADEAKEFVDGLGSRRA
jgi:ParB family transcriptional regulator, chromosome partitioning protein